MNYTSIIQHFENKLHRFVLSENSKQKLDEESAYVLADIGLPAQIVYNKFIFYNEASFDETGENMLLGHHVDYKDWELKLNLKDYSVYHFGKIDRQPIPYCFYNSSVRQLLLCLYESDTFYRNVIAKKALGEYHTFHGEYSRALENIIRKIDPEAIKQGIWYSYIEEMSTGVI